MFTIFFLTISALENLYTNFFENQIIQESLKIDSDKIHRTLLENCLNTTEINCTKCMQGYYISSGNCSKCSENCVNCSSQSLCTSCASGYYLSGSSCLACNEYCLECNSTNCTFCNNSLIPVGINCSCGIGYFYENNICAKCQNSILQSIITGPTDYSTKCTNLEYSASNSYINYSQPTNYLWTLIQYTDKEIWRNIYDSETITVSGIIKQDSTLNVTLSISNCGYFSNTTILVTIRTISGFLINNSGGNMIFTNTFSSLSIQAQVIDYCGGSGSLSWSWIGVINQSGKFFHILENALSPGTYSFSLQANLGTISATNTFQIITKENPIVIIFSRSSGFSSIYSDLLVSASGSYDPDGNLSLSYFWNCAYLNSSSCLDIEGNILVNSSLNEISINQQRLLNATTLIISANVSTNSKFTTSSITITLVDTNDSVLINQSSLRINPQIDLRINSILKIFNSSIIWSCLQGVQINLSNLPVLLIPKNSLLDFPSYTFQLKTAENLLSFVTIYANTPPNCFGELGISNNIAVFGEPINLISPLCYDEDYPVFFTYNYVTPFYNSLNLTLLLPVGNYNVTMQVCDSLEVCLELNQSVTINLFQMNYSDIMSTYQNYSKSIDLIPSTIIAFGLSLMLSSDIVDMMWNDLISYQTLFSDSATPLVASIQALVCDIQNNTVINERINIFIGNLTNFQKILGINPRDNIFYLQIVSSVANLKTNSMILLAESILNNCIYPQNMNFLPGQSLNFSSNSISIIKIASIGNSLNNFTFAHNTRNISLPSSLPFNSTSIINLYLYMFFATGNYSDIISITFTNSGEYSNSYLNFTQEKIINLTNLPIPIISTIIYYKRVKNAWACAYLDLNIWYSDGCEILSNDSKSLTFSANHTSLFSAFDILEVKLPPPIYIDSSNNCGSTYNGIWIIIVITFLLIILLPLLYFADNSDRNDLKKYQDVKKEEHSEEVGSPSYSEDVASNNLSSDYAIQYKPKVLRPKKSKCSIFLESHLLFGIFIFREEFNRVLRILTIYSTLCFQLLLEGLLMYGFEKTNSGQSSNAQQYFNDYKNNYFGYTIFAIIISLVLEISLIILFSMKGKMRNFGIFTGIILLLLSIIGDIIGIAIMSVKFCPNWSGYWAISFIWSTIVEIFFIQSIYMIIRFWIVIKSK